MNRVLVLVPFALDDDGLARRSDQLREVSLRPDISYEFRPVKAGPTSFTSPHDWLLLDVALFEAGIGAEDEGFSAVVIDTVSDSGADALRSMLDIPVVAPGRASLIFSLSLGRRFGVMAQWEPALARYEKVLDLGSTTMHKAHAHLSSVLDVPVVNPGPLSYKLVETMLGLGLSQSRSAYPKPLVAKPDMFSAMLAAAAEIEDTNGADNG